MYMSWKARSVDFYNRFIELATDLNGNMPRFVVQKIGDILNDRSKSIKESKILILGMAYKKNISDLRESPGLEIFGLLKDKGAVVEYADPHVGSFKYLDDAVIYAVKIDRAGLKQYDVAVLVTNHDDFDYELIANECNVILDCRNVFSNKGVAGDHIVKL
jgi:UDP-N-acetyl-D-glucosamine dehydrogenase